MLRLAQASSSEYFTEWGEPPNQRRTGTSVERPQGNMDGELNVIPFYGGWKWAFRAKDPGVSERIAWIAERAVMNGAHIGYGQNNGRYPRTGLFDELMKQKDPFQIAAKINCDCSSLAGAAVYHAGVKDMRLRDMWTGNEREILLSTGQFVEITDPLLLSIGTGLRRGDILLKPGHTAIAIDSDDHRDATPYRITDCAFCNVRSGPGTEYKVIHTLTGGDIVMVIATAANGWKKILLDGGLTGYVSGKYCNQPLPETKAKGDCWLRETPGTSGKTIIVIQKGETVYLTGKTQRVGIRIWKECVYATHTGWSSSLYI